VDLIGTSPQMTALRAEISRIARVDARVLITGESGVGKEVVARAINASSPRAERPFIPVNCAGIPEPLLESEMFGHVKGSFTGAYRDRPGKLEMSRNGTIFLDEIGEMTLRMQGALLRFLETGEIQRVGADGVYRVDNVRVMSATNRKLRELVAAGQFREDLFYRLNVIHLRIPPLRDRREDIPLLVDHFIRRYSAALDSGSDSSVARSGGVECRPVACAIAPEAVAALCRYSWPGNVRELENVIERLIVTCQHEVIRVDHLGREFRQARPSGEHPRTERRRTIADELYRQLVTDRASFWSTVYPLYRSRDITRDNLRQLLHKGLEEARGNYKIVLRLFNMEPGDYKRFLNFLRKHDCQLPFQQYRH
jgi:transcriptional regulator with PAS, ATPase and Fis domain